jgi:hypothetical protein
MSFAEIDRALRELRLSGISATLDGCCKPRPASSRFSKPSP